MSSSAHGPSVSVARTASAEAADLDLIRLALREQSGLIAALHASLTTANLELSKSVAQISSRLDSIIETLATLVGEHGDPYADAETAEHPPLPR